MKLKDYISMIGITPAEASRSLSKARGIVVSPQVMYLWCAGERIPRPDNMRDIYIWSQGAVTPGDFYDLPALAAGDCCNSPMPTPDIQSEVAA